MTSKLNILTISDQHFPFHHPKVFKFLRELSRDTKWDFVVNLGDELDHYRISRYPTDPETKSALDEYKAGLEYLKELYDLFPNVLACTSNHTARPFKKALEAQIPSVFLKQYHETLEAPEGWRWRDHWMIEGVRYFHGEPFSGPSAARNAMNTHRRSCVMGHLHSNAGVTYSNNGHDQIWALNAGCLIDTDAYAFEYGKHSRDKPVIGTGVIIEGTPHFIPLT